MTGPLQTRVSRFLFNYRTTSHTTTGATPAELLMGRRLRTHLDLVYPSKEQRFRKQQEKQVENKCQSKKKPKSFLVGERVMQTLHHVLKYRVTCIYIYYYKQIVYILVL